MNQSDSKIEIELQQDFEGVEIDAARMKELIKFVCERYGIGNAYISLAIVSDDEIIKVNREFLDHNFTTDVISFDLSDESDDSKAFELVVNGQMATRQSAERKHSTLAEVALYITHGLLHNLGFDDTEAEKARVMHETEDEILAELGFGRVYNK